MEIKKGSGLSHKKGSSPLLCFYVNPPPLRIIERMAIAPIMIMPITTSENANQMLVWVADHVLLASVLHVSSGVTEFMSALTMKMPTRIGEYWQNRGVMHASGYFLISQGAVYIGNFSTTPFLMQ